MFSYSMSDKAILAELGAQIKQMRLNQNVSQAKLATNSGLARSTISELENRGNGSMMSLVQVLRSLKRLELLNMFSTEVMISPVQVAKLYGKKRKRASGNHDNKDNLNKNEW